MTNGRPKMAIVLGQREREQLEDLASNPALHGPLATRAAIILRSVDGDSNIAIAEELALTQATVGKWRTRFASRRVPGLYDSMRPGKPRTIDDSQLQAIAATAHSEPLPGMEPQCSLRALAARTGMSKSSVARYLQMLGKQAPAPDVALFNDPLLMEQLQAHAALYLGGCDQALVICLDTQTPISLPAPQTQSAGLDARAAPQAADRTHPLSAALTTACNGQLPQCKPQLRHQELLVFLRDVEAMVPADLEVHCILDTPALSQHPRIKAWLGMRPQWRAHNCSDYSAWHRQLARFLSQLGKHGRTSLPAQELALWLQSVDTLARQHNPSRKPFRWLGQLQPQAATGQTGADAETVALCEDAEKPDTENP